MEELGPEKVRKNRLEESNQEALTAGLNVLAGQGWELVAIEPYWQTQTKGGGGHPDLPAPPHLHFQAAQVMAGGSATVPGRQLPPHLA